MVKTMGQLFGFYAETRANQPDNFFKLPKNYVGIEVELENIPNINNYLHKITRKNDDHWPTRLPNLEEIHDQRIGLLNFGNKLWYVGTDGSLRNNGVEFISKKIFGKDIRIAINDLLQFLNTYYVGVNFPDQKSTYISDRTSIHIHVDIRDFSFDEFLHFICNYLVFEDFLFQFAEPQRKHNNYCIPWKVAPFTYKNLCAVFALKNKKDREQLFLGQLTKFYKYSALNLLSLAKFGTVEFRHYPGTLDLNRILDWINILLSLKANSYNKGPNLFPETFSQVSATTYATNIFDHYYTTIQQGYPTLEEDMYSGMRFAQDLLYVDSFAAATEQYYKDLMIKFVEKAESTHRLPIPNCKIQRAKNLGIALHKKSSLANLLSYYETLLLANGLHLPQDVCKRISEKDNSIILKEKANIVEESPNIVMWDRALDFNMPPIRGLMHQLTVNDQPLSSGDLPLVDGFNEE